MYLGTNFVTYTERNGYRVEDFHELNMSFTWTPKPHRERYRGSWNLSIMNVYNRKNVFGIFTQNEQDEMGVTHLKATKMYLYGILPMISYEFKF